MKAESAGRKRPLKLKRNACEACYRSRVKCIYTDNDRSTCVRCARQKRECIPRVVVRGRASQVSKSADTDMSEVDIDAYRSVALFENLPHLTLHYSAAASMVRTYKSLGLSKPPTSLRWTVNVLYLLALSEKSVGLLHTASTLAVSIGVGIDFDLLNSRASPLTDADKRSVENEVHGHFLRDDGTLREASFIIRLDSGDRGIVANDAYEFLFERASDMVHRLQRAPHFRLWRQFVPDQAVCDSFSSSIVKAYLGSGTQHGAPSQVTWSATAPDRVQLRDAQGNGFSAVMYEHGVMAADGFLVFLVFGFRDIAPLDDGARARMAAFRPPGGAEAAGGSGAPGRELSSTGPSAMTVLNDTSFRGGGAFNGGSLGGDNRSGSGRAPYATPVNSGGAAAQPPSRAPSTPDGGGEVGAPPPPQAPGPGGPDGGSGRVRSLSRFDSLFSEMMPPPAGEDDAWAAWGDGLGNGGSANGGASANGGGVGSKGEHALRADEIAENVRNGRPPWESELPRMDSCEMLEALDKAFDSVGGKEVLESGSWKH